MDLSTDLPTYFYYILAIAKEKKVLYAVREKYGLRMIENSYHCYSVNV